MSSVALPVAPVVGAGSPVWTLARIEALRFARHPLFLVGFAFAVIFSAGQHGPIELDYHVIPSFFIGVLGLVVAARLTASTRRSGPVVDAAPASEPLRTAALCLACAVPAVAGLLVVLMHRAFILADPIPEFMYGTYGSMDRFLITVAVPVIACAGGPLLGVAVGRWWHFPGAALIAVIIVLLWSNVAAYVPAQSAMDASSLAARVLHMLTPYTAFGEGNGDGELASTAVTSYTGSVIWFTVWTLALCGLATAAALWRGAQGKTRRVVRRWLAGFAALAVVALVLSVATGNEQLYETTASGTVAVAAE